MARRPSRASVKWSIKRDIDPIAIAALLLSGIAVASQVVAWVKGPSVQLVPPERVVLYSQQFPGGVIVRIGAPISYANVASQSYGALVIKETASFRVGQLASDQEWNAFGTIDAKNGPTIVRSTDIALPVALPGQSSVSHLTLFAPLRKRCQPNDRACNPTANYISPEQFAAGLATAAEIDVTFAIKLSNGSELTASCAVPINPASKPHLEQVRTEVFYGVCYPTNR